MRTPIRWRPEKGHSARGPNENPTETPRWPPEWTARTPTSSRFRAPSCRGGRPRAADWRTRPRFALKTRVQAAIERTVPPSDYPRTRPGLCSATMSVRTPARFAALLLALVGSSALADDPFAGARQIFLLAYAAVEVGAPLPSAIDPEALRDYPLYPYLERARLAHALGRAQPDSSAVDDDVRAFLAEHAGEPVATDLRRAWLASLASRQQWQTFLASFDPSIADAELRCDRARAKVALDADDATRAAIELWLAPQRLPAECEAVFDWLRAHGALTDELVEQRARALLANGQPAFARTIARDLPAASRGAATAVGRFPREARADDRRVPPGPREPARRRRRVARRLDEARAQRAAQRAGTLRASRGARRPGARRRLWARTRVRPRVGPARARGARRVREASGSAARRQRARVASARRALGARLGASRALDPRDVGRAADAAPLAVLGRALGRRPQ